MITYLQHQQSLCRYTQSYIHKNVLYSKAALSLYMNPFRGSEEKEMLCPQQNKFYVQQKNIRVIFFLNNHPYFNISLKCKHISLLF